MANVNFQCCVIVTLPGKSFSYSRKANNYEQSGTCGQVWTMHLELITISLLDGEVKTKDRFIILPTPILCFTQVIFPEGQGGSHPLETRDRWSELPAGAKTGPSQLKREPGWWLWCRGAWWGGAGWAGGGSKAAGPAARDGDGAQESFTSSWQSYSNYWTSSTRS